MKAVFAFALTAAVLASASPVEKRGYVTHHVVQTVTEFVYKDGTKAYPTPAPKAGEGHFRGDKKKKQKPKVDVAPVDIPKADVKPAPVDVPAPVDIPAPPVQLDTPPAPESGPSQPAYNPPSPAGDDLISQALYAHNVHRANHSAGPLEWSDEHANYAAILAQSCVFDHNTDYGGGGYGQNLGMMAQTNLPSDAMALSQSITNFWYNDELNLFPYFGSEPNMGNFHAWGHLTAVLWKGTQKVGCATAHCPAGTLSSMESIYSVCNYYPAGNVAGQFAANVEPALGQPFIRVNL